MAEQNNRLGIILIVLSTMIFAGQDALSRHLVETYNIYMVLTVRYWAFAAFVVVLALRKGGLAAALRPRHPVLQLLRGAILVVEIGVTVIAFVKLGLIETHAAFASYPLMVAALSGPILGEKVGWRRWSAIGVGFIGVLIILQPGGGLFSVWSLLPLSGALMFAVYGLLTRYVARADAALVSFFWTAVTGAVLATPFGLWHWQAMTPGDWAMMSTLCCTAMISHWLFIRAYEMAEAAALQPFSYLLLVWASGLGMVIFGETLRTNVMIGTALIVASGLFTLWRQHLRQREAQRQAAAAAVSSPSARA